MPKYGVKIVLPVTHTDARASKFRLYRIKDSTGMEFFADINIGVSETIDYDTTPGVSYYYTAVDPTSGAESLPSPVSRIFNKRSTTPFIVIPPGNIRFLEMSKIKSFAYQLQNADMSAIANTGFGLAITDISPDGTESLRYTQGQILTAKNSSAVNQSKYVIAYLNIGAAENHRWYWESSWDTNPPAFIGPEIPSQTGNFQVKYWDPEWQKLVLKNPSTIRSSLDRIIDAGFDGVYLDGIEAFNYWGPVEIAGNNIRRTAAPDMMSLVKNIANHARNTRGKINFFVLVQNGSNIITSDPFVDDIIPVGYTKPDYVHEQSDLYFDAIDAISAEYVFYNGTLANNNMLNPQLNIISDLQLFRAANKAVLTTDYLSPYKSNPLSLLFPENIDNCYTLARAQTFIPYCTVYERNTLTINPTQSPLR